MSRSAVERWVALLRGFRFSYGDEKQLQDAIETLLTRLGAAFAREQDLGEAGVIDFLLSEDRVGLEIKVKGSPSSVAAQLLRYARRPELEGLILLTAKSTLARALPATMAGKPAAVVWLGSNCL